MIQERGLTQQGTNESSRGEKLDFIIKGIRQIEDYGSVVISQEELHKRLKEGETIQDIFNELVYDEEHGELENEPGGEQFDVKSVSIAEVAEKGDSGT